MAKKKAKKEPTTRSVKISKKTLEVLQVASFIFDMTISDLIRECVAAEIPNMLVKTGRVAREDKAYLRRYLNKIEE